MGALTVKMLSQIVRYEVGGKPGTPLEFSEIVNEAGEYLVSCFPWRWLEGRPIVLRSRASITLTAATWTETTPALTLTEVGAFADYTFTPGDTVVITGGTGATEGVYNVASRTDDDSIVLEETIGAAADASTDIAGRLPNDQILLPTGFDVQRIVSIQAKDLSISVFNWTMAQGLLDIRAWPGLESTTSFWGFMNYHRAATGGAPVQRMEVWPESSTASEFVTLTYSGGWLEPEDDNSELSIPQDLNGIFTSMVKAVAMGYEDPESGSVENRLSAVTRSDRFQYMIARDAMLQPDLGEMENGWMATNGNQIGRYDVPNPTVEPAP